MGPTRSRAMYSHLAIASLTWLEQNRYRGSGPMRKGCSFSPKYSTVLINKVPLIYATLYEKCQESSPVGRLLACPCPIREREGMSTTTPPRVWARRRCRGWDGGHITPLGPC